MAEKPQEAPPPQKDNAEKPASGAEGGRPAGKGRQMLLSALLLVGLVVGAASAAVVVASVVMRPSAAQSAQNPADKEDEQAADQKSAGGPCEFALENALIVNVYQTQQRRYLSVKPVLVLNSKDALETVTKNQIELQHLLIGILKTKTLEQLDDPDATNIVGREIQDTLNLKLELKNGVTSVYFTQFVVQ